MSRESTIEYVTVSMFSNHDFLERQDSCNFEH